MIPYAQRYTRRVKAGNVTYKLPLREDGIPCRGASEFCRVRRNGDGSITERTFTRLKRADEV
jgi:hypothetical protein